MTNCDLAINLDEETINTMIAVLFNRESLKRRLFNGSKQITLGGVEVVVGWEVQQVPIVHLTPPSLEQWQKAIKGNSEAVQPTENAFTIDFPSLKVTKQETSGVVESSTTSVSAICTIAVSQNKISFQPIALVVDLSQAPEFDKKVTYPKVIIPQILGMAGPMFSGIQLPNISFQGVQFGSEVVTVGNHRLVLIANLNGKSPPLSPSVNDFPEGAFYLLLSREAMQQIANQGVNGLRGKSDGKSGSQKLGITTAKYNANIRLDNVLARVSDPDLTTLNIGVSPSISVSAALTTFLGDVGFSYNVKTESSMIGAKVFLRFSGTTLKAIVQQVDPFIMTLTPSGNVAQTILSGVVWPLAQTLGVILPPILKNLINGYSFNIVSISFSTQSVEGEIITVDPSNLDISNHSDRLIVKGEVDIS